MSDFKGLWVSADILEMDDINLTDKVVLAEVAALCKGGKGCVATNKHMANRLGISTATITRSLATLMSMGHITQARTAAGERILHSTLKAPEPPGTPTEDDVMAYAERCGWLPREFNPAAFIDYYSQREWKINGQPLKDWRKVAAAWVKRYRDQHPNEPKEQPLFGQWSE